MSVGPISVVLGSNWGDCGKGLLTDYLCRRNAPATCVRFNGGAQAGHTVSVDGGPRHVFHHIGSGTFAGAKTLLGPDFIFNPVLLLKELASFPANGTPQILVHPKCAVTTIWDMYINQLIERSRGADRHGSCGVGINETVERNITTPLTVKDLTEPNLRMTLKWIAMHWQPRRVKALGLSQKLAEEAEAWSSSLSLLNRFLNDCVEAMTKITVTEDLPSGPLVFEGAQGLALDQNAPGFPHVTRSNTGLDNVLPLIGDREAEVVYVTRWYLTRHGAGPLPEEDVFPPLPSMLDATNITNEWQGTMRYAILDIDALAARIEADFRKAPAGQFRKSIAVTCLDQIAGPFSVRIGGKIVLMRPEDAARRIVQAIEAAVKPTGRVYQSWGPTATTIIAREAQW